MSKQRHRRRSQGGTTPETKPQNGSGVAQFSVSEVAQFWMSVDKVNVLAALANLFMARHLLLCKTCEVVWLSWTAPIVNL